MPHTPRFARAPHALTLLFFLFFSAAVAALLLALPILSLALLLALPISLVRLAFLLRVLALLACHLVVLPVR
jgi:hypothetical protein